jgi:LPS sulfotransferase NodH
VGGRRKIGIMKKLFIASEVRSGSTYIAEKIAYSLNKSYGIHFWSLTKEHFSSLESGFSANQIIKIFNEIGVNDINFKSAKLMPSSLSIIYKESEKNTLIKDIFFGENSYWIVIQRKDKLAQAVSLTFAREGNLFHYYGDESISPDLNISIKNEEVYKNLISIILSDIFLDNFFKNNSRVISIYYEDFIENEYSILTSIIEKFQLPLSVNNFKISPVKLKKTASKQKARAIVEFSKYFKENYHK